MSKVINIYSHFMLDVIYAKEHDSKICRFISENREKLIASRSYPADTLGL